MAFNLSVKTKALSRSTKISPQIILDIEGVELIFGTNPVLEVTRWDGENLEWDSSLFWDSESPKAESRDYIELGGTTKNITQQIKVDKGGSSSITTATIELLDKDSEVAKAFSFDAITEILGRRCKMYTGFAAGAFPEDMIPVLFGYITDIAFENGSVLLSIASSEALKRQNLFNKVNTNLAQAINFKSLQVQDIFYSQRFKNDPELSIRYVAGGATAASIANNLITITVTGSTTAEDIGQAINDVYAVKNEVDFEVNGIETNIQTVFPTTIFETDTTLSVLTTDGLIESADDLTSFVKINEEIMEILSIVDETTLSVQRGTLGTIASGHELDDDVESYYTLTGNPLEVARKLMLSDGNQEFTDINITAKSANFDVGNAILFDYFDIEQYTGLEIGDTLRIPSGINAGDYSIAKFGTRDEGDSYIETLGLLPEPEALYTVSFRSQWNVFNAGLGMLPDDVDLPQFANVQREFGNSFVSVNKKVKDTMDNVKAFIDDELFFPQSMYSIIRGAKTSVSYTAPPLSVEVLPVLSADSVTNPDKIKQMRASYKYLYNEIFYDYNEDVLEDKFLNVLGYINEDSKNRIKIGNKQLRINAGLLERSNLTVLALDLAANRLMTRYKFAAQYYSGVKVLYKDFFNVEVGDTVILDGESLQFVDPSTGLRNLPLEQYSILNKKINIVDGHVTLDIVNTGFLLSQRFGVFSPSSEIVSGSTTTNLILRETLSTNEFEFEPQRYTDFIGGQIRVRSYDYTFDEITTIEAISTTNLNAIVVSALSQAPQDGWVFELPNYDDLNVSEVSDLYKLKYTFEMYQVEITSVVDESTFDVDDTTNLFIGQIIQVHSQDYLTDSDDVEIANIVGNTITLETALEFIPVATDKVEARSFADGDGYSLR